MSIVGLLTDFLPKECSGVQRVARGVDSDEISSVEIILKGDLAFRVEDCTELQSPVYTRQNVTRGTHFLPPY